MIHNTIVTLIFVQIQAETSVGKGEFSEEIDVFPLGMFNNSLLLDLIMLLFSHLVATSTTTISSGGSSALLLVAILTPLVAVILILIFATTIIGIKWFSVRKKSSTSPSHMIECYASIKLPSQTGFNAVSAPPLPCNPRPQQYSIDENPSYEWASDNGVYWNEELGPNQQLTSQITTSPEVQPCSTVCTSGQVSGPVTDPSYLELIPN